MKKTHQEFNIRSFLQSKEYKDKNEQLKSDINTFNFHTFNLCKEIQVKNEPLNREEFKKTDAERLVLKDLKKNCTNKGKLTTIVKVW